MKWFWYSLIIFCLLLCSCKTQKLDSNVQVRSDVRSELSYYNESCKIDSSKTAYFANEVQRVVVEEVISVIEYDKESGKPIKETTSKRKTTQDTEKVVAEEESKGVTIEQSDSLNHFRDAKEMVDADVKEESIGGQETFGKYFGITLGCVIGLLVIYLLVKLRVN